MTAKLSSRRRRRLLRWIAFLIAAAIVVLYLALPIGFAVSVVLPYQQTVGAPPAGFEAVTLTTDDQVELAGWYKPPSNGAVIIVLHGAGGSREEMRSYTDLLTRHGYGVLALDLRGHGSSDGRTNRFGWQGTRDVGAAIKFLQSREDVKAIGGLGSSLGGEVLLGAASTYPEIKAIIADGATTRSLDELLMLESERPLYRNFTARVMYAAVQIFSGETPPVPLLDSMLAAPVTSYLLIAGGANQREVAFNQLFTRATSNRSELWIAPEAPHTGAFALYPAEYEQHVIEFFATTLLQEFTAQ
jgi:pimeloyl-ACP methyl ester carboxylesterase